MIFETLKKVYFIGQITWYWGVWQECNIKSRDREVCVRMSIIHNVQYSQVDCLKHYKSNLNTCDKAIYTEMIIALNSSSLQIIRFPCTRLALNPLKYMCVMESFKWDRYDEAIEDNYFHHIQISRLYWKLASMEYWRHSLCLPYLPVKCGRLLQCPVWFY